MLQRWKRNVRTSWEQWWTTNRDHLQTTVPEWAELIHTRGESACRHADCADFWSWTAGSGVFFWWWPTEFTRDVATGVPPLWTSAPQQRIERQSTLGDKAMIAMISDKVQDVRSKGYVCPSTNIRATMNYFAVPKGNTDVQMVYDGTKSGLNKCLYARWFFLPDSDQLARTLDEGFWCIDYDYGEMFLNFWLHPELEQYSGMDFTLLYGKHNNGQLWIEAWTRCPMGQSPSPFVTIQQTRRLKRLILGDSQDRHNIFQWGWANRRGCP
ncbi:hypothetical protein ACA910_010204 [Epithemia clementina (nom. ined.)]